MYQQMCAELPPYSSTVTETSLAGMISWDTGGNGGKRTNTSRTLTVGGTSGKYCMVKYSIDAS